MAHKEINSEQEFKNAIAVQGKFVLIIAHENGIPADAEKYAEQGADKVDSYQVDLKKNPHVKEVFGSKEYPSIVVFKDGKEIKKIDGPKPEDVQTLGALFQ